MNENGLIAGDFLPKLFAATGFRNRLVHRCWDVANEKVFSILQENLPDLRRLVDELKSRVPVMLKSEG